MIDDGEIYQALRESLALRPPPSELIGLFIRRNMASANDSRARSAADPTAFLRQAAQRFTDPSDRATDPNHPVGAMAAAIRSAFPDFEDWPLDVGEAAARFFTDDRGRLHVVLPPGFAEGVQELPACDARRAAPEREGPVQSIYQLLQDSPDEQTFRAARTTCGSATCSI